MAKRTLISGAKCPLTFDLDRRNASVMNAICYWALSGNNDVMVPSPHQLCGCRSSVAGSAVLSPCCVRPGKAWHGFVVADPSLSDHVARPSMAVLLENVTNCVWHAFLALQQNKTGTVHKSRLKVTVCVVAPPPQRPPRPTPNNCDRSNRCDSDIAFYSLGSVFLCANLVSSHFTCWLLITITRILARSYVSVAGNSFFTNF